MLRKLIPVYNKLQEKQALLEDLASREARLRERTHKPIGKLLSILEAANTAAVSDLYYLFTKANMKYRPRYNNILYIYLFHFFFPGLFEWKRMKTHHTAFGCNKLWLVVKKYFTFHP